ncbi:MAG: PAS domain S-box protein [Pseudomonadota bacterium]
MSAREESSVRLLRAVVDTAVDGVIVIDANGTVSMFNPACERLFGYKAAEAIGQNVKMLMPGPYQSNHDGYLANYQNTGERKIIGIGREVVGRRKDGTTFPMDLSVGEAKSDNQTLFVGVIHDLSQRKRTEQQLAQAQKMETVGQLSGGIAHDFNNLLTVIIGNAEALSLRLKAREDLRRLSDTIITAAERGAELTQRLLAFSRRQVLQPLPTDCNLLLESMQILLKRTLRDDVELRIAVAPTPVIALADPGQLESAVLNLVINAQDAMPKGGLLHISADEVQLDEDSLADAEVKPGRYVVVCVSDNGQGMSEEVRRRVFEPFFTTKDVGKGSGLGLSMVYGFARQSNGHVAIYSEVGFGTSVRIYLPVTEKTQSDTGAKTQARETPGGAETILVVEDDSLVRSHAVATLEALGYRVLVAADSRDALAVLRGGARPHLIFTDIVMPGGATGWDLARQAREFVPNVKVLFTSGYPLETLADRAVLPVNAHLINKPYRMADLARRVREELDSAN